MAASVRNREAVAVRLPMDDPSKLADTIAANLQLGVDEKQRLLDVFDPETRLAVVADMLEKAGSELSTSSVGPLSIPLGRLIGQLGSSSLRR